MEFEGPKGTIYIRPEDHVAIQDMYIATLTNVDDPEFKYFDYVATNRPNVPCLLPEEHARSLRRPADWRVRSVVEATTAPAEEEMAAELSCEEPVKVGSDHR